MANQYDKPGATPANITQINNTAADLATNIGICQLGIGNDLGILVYKDKDSVVRRSLSSATLTDGYIPRYSSSVYNVANSAIYHDSSNRIVIGGTTGTQKLTIIDGSLALDANYNIYGGSAILKLSETSTNDMVFYPNGSEKVRFTSGGNVVIGGTTATQKLTLKSGSIALDANYNLMSGNSIIKMSETATGDMTFSTNSSERARIVNGGNVGIGITNPNNLLCVGNTPLASGLHGVSVGNSATDSHLAAGQDSTHCGVLAWCYNATAANAYASIGTYGYYNPIKIDGSELHLQSLATGNIGIGTASPSQKLHVYSSAVAQKIALFENANASNGASQVAQVKASTADLSLKVYSAGYTGTYFGTNYANLALISNDNGPILTCANDGTSPIIFCETSAETARFTGGKLLIGGTTGSSRLTVKNGDISLSVNYSLKSNTSSITLDETSTDDMVFYTNGNERFRIYDLGGACFSGNLGIGGTSIAQKLTVTGGSISIDDTYGIMTGNAILKLSDSSGLRAATMDNTSSADGAVSGVIVKSDLNAINVKTYGSGCTGTIYGLTKANLGAITSAYQLAVGTSSAIPLLLLANGAEAVRVNSGGNVGIGNTSNSHLLDMESSGGGFYAATDHQWHNGSTLAIKKNVSKNKIDVIDLIKKLEIVEYNYKTESDTDFKHVGFIADTADEHFSGKNHDSQSTADCIGILLAVVKEQQKAIETLQRKTR